MSSCCGVTLSHACALVLASPLPPVAPTRPQSPVLLTCGGRAGRPAGSYMFAMFEGGKQDAAMQLARAAAEQVGDYWFLLATAMEPILKYGSRVQLNLPPWHPSSRILRLPPCRVACVR